VLLEGDVLGALVALVYVGARRSHAALQSDRAQWLLREATPRVNGRSIRAVAVAQVTTFEVRSRTGRGLDQAPGLLCLGQALLALEQLERLVEPFACLVVLAARGEHVGERQSGFGA
jgi:hypothetical protein